MKIGILLAAGLGRRFGGGKMIHPLPNGTPMALQSARHLRPFVDELICVVQPQDQVLKDLFQAEHYHVCENSNYADGMSSSIKTGIRYCDDLLDRSETKNDEHYFVIALGDMPYIDNATYAQLNITIERELSKPSHEQRITRPAYSSMNCNPPQYGSMTGGRYLLCHTSEKNKNAANSLKMGHPVAFPTRFKPALLKLKSNEGAQTFIKPLMCSDQRDDAINLVYVEDKGVLLDIDRVEDIIS